MELSDASITCAACGKEEGGDSLKACTACKLEKYCNRDCQIAHRPQHKKACKKRAAEILNEGTPPPFKEPATASPPSMNANEKKIREILAEAEAKRFPGDPPLSESLASLVLSTVKQLTYEGKGKVECGCGNTFKSKGENAEICNVCDEEKCIQCLDRCEACGKRYCDDEDCSKPCYNCYVEFSCTKCLVDKKGKLYCQECV